MNKNTLIVTPASREPKVQENAVLVEKTQLRVLPMKKAEELIRKTRSCTMASFVGSRSE